MECEGAIYATSMHIAKNRTISDTGASHHFVSIKESFTSLTQCERPFKIDQAAGVSRLNSQGTAVPRIRSLNLTLHDALFSPQLSCNNISAGRLKKIANIVPNYSKSLLLQRNEHTNDKPITSLICQNNVYYIHPISVDSKLPIATPDVVKVPLMTRAQRWHQRLSHSGQTILKKTAQISKGLEGIDLIDLTICETYHLSKAQRFVSREPRLIPNEPLDEIHIDNVGK